MELRLRSLIGHTMESVACDEAFEQLPRRIAELTDGVSALLQVHGASGARPLGVYGFPDGVWEAYADHYWVKDPWATMCQSTALNVAFASETMISDMEMQNSEIYSDLLSKVGGHFRCVAFMSDLGEGELLGLGTHRTRGQPAFDPSSVQAIQTLQPWLVHLVQARRRISARGGKLAERLLDEEVDAILVVSRDGRTLYANAAALRSLDGAGPLRLERGRVSPADAAQAATLARAINWACAGRGGSQWMMAGRHGTSRVSVDALPGVDSALAVLRVHDPELALQTALTRAGSSFGFTTAERRLAEGLMRGLSPSDYAEQCSVSVTTVRTQLRSLFAKAGVARQTELILKLRAFGG